MGQSVDSLVARTGAGLVPLQALQDATFGGLPALAVAQADATAAAVLVRGAGTLLDLKDAASVSRFKVDNSGNLTAGSVSGQLLRTPTSYAPGTQQTPAVSTTTMAAFDSANINTGAFAAPPSGNVLVTASFLGAGSAASCFSAFGLAAHGTVTPMVGNQFQTEVSSSGAVYSYSLPFLVTGLTGGTSYNFDLLGCVTSAMTFTIFALGATSTTPTLGAGGRGGPVVLTVQAV